MKIKEFNESIEEIINICKNTLIKKQDEYNLDLDRLSFFKNNYEFTKLPPEKILYVFMFKHIKSLADMINSEKKYSRALWEEKIKDNINYLLLLWALLKDDNMFEGE